MNEIKELIEMLKSSDASYLIAKFEEYYKNYIADRRIAVDFKDFYGNKSAKVLCILVPAQEAIQRDKNIVRR